MEALVSSEGGAVETRVEAGGRRRWLASSLARRQVTSLPPPSTSTCSLMDPSASVSDLGGLLIHPYRGAGCGPRAVECGRRSGGWGGGAAVVSERGARGRVARTE
jgi:hypothetical protein